MLEHKKIYVYLDGGYDKIFSFIFHCDLVCNCLGDLEGAEQPCLPKHDHYSISSPWKSQVEFIFVAQIKLGGFTLLLYRLVEKPVALHGYVFVIIFLGCSSNGQFDNVIMWHFGGFSSLRNLCDWKPFWVSIYTIFICSKKT